MKMGFLLKNNARKGMGRKRSAQKGRGKGVLKKGEEKEAEKGLQNSRILKRMAGLGGNSQILKAGETLFKNFRTISRHSHNVNKSE